MRYDETWPAVRARAVFAALLTGALAAGGCGNGEEPPAGGSAPAVRRAGVVEAQLVERAVHRPVAAVVSARRRSLLAVRAVAAVAAVPVREGDRVSAGQELVRLDDRDPAARTARASAAIREAEDALAEAERAVRAVNRNVEATEAAAGLAAVTRARLDGLHAKGAIPTQARDEAASRDGEARAHLARTREELAAARLRQEQSRSRLQQVRAEAASIDVGRSDTRLFAPFAGVIASRPPDPGTLATPATVLLVLEDGPRLECPVPASWLPDVRPGDTVPVQLDAPSEAATGVVEEVAPTADPVARTVLVRVGLPAGVWRRSGAFGRVLVPAGRRRAIEVPAGCVTTRGQLQTVFVVDAEGMALLRLVSTGATDGDRVEVLAGLAPGERVVCGGPADLAEGDRIEVPR